MWEQSPFLGDWVSASMLSAHLNWPHCSVSFIMSFVIHFANPGQKPANRDHNKLRWGRRGGEVRKRSRGMARRTEIEREREGRETALCLNSCRQQTGRALCHLFADLPIPSTAFHLVSFPPNFQCAALLTCVCPFFFLRFPLPVLPCFVSDLI